MQKRGKRNQRAQRINYVAVSAAALLGFGVLVTWLNALFGWTPFWQFLFVISGITFVVYGYDKRQAQRKGWRIPERILHGYALLGGFAGAWLGMVIFRHKTRKPIFRGVIVLGALLWTGVWWWLGR